MSVKIYLFLPSQSFFHTLIQALFLFNLKLKDSYLSLVDDLVLD